ncbi:MAG TPA: RnfABCDGE type electron transport complex subunit B [Phycisphaerae bacterium]|nr:RnfABCDGE type electron transport complex subunit B [Phycisphaerae bacterium]HUT58837.1 RnfABCDGE type electron transport complex subunit B [Phycisphaerae bacterium]
MTLIIALAAATMLALAVVMATILGWANRKFHVEVDPRVEQVTAALPGANCGGCGYVGCNEYAEAVVAGEAPPDKCTVGGASCAAALANILGVDLKPSWPYRPVVHCGATYDQRLGRNEYRGEPTCTAANLIAGVQGCTYGCLGLGDCERACSFDAVHMVDGLATIDYDRCVGCGACERACPRHIISMVPFKAERMLVVACSNKDFGKDVKAVCKVGCLGCKACTRASDLFTVEDNISRIDYDKYDPEKMDAANVALTKCPMKRIVEVGKPSAKDLAAVADEAASDIVAPDFKTTVDKTEWHG